MQQRSDTGISPEDRFFFKLYKIVFTEGRQTLHFVYTWGTEKQASENILEYLQKKGIKNNLNKTMQEMVERYNNPSGGEYSENYDISLLYTCIRWSCCGLSENQIHWSEGDDSKVESLCTFVKNYRNRLAHQDTAVPDEKTLQDKVQEFQDKLEKLIMQAGSLYGQEKCKIDTEIQKMKLQIKMVMSAILQEDDIEKYSAQIKQLRKEQENIVSIEGRQQLADYYESKTNVDPVSFISGKERIQVGTVFTELIIVQKEEDKKSSSDEEGFSSRVPYNSLLSLKVDKDTLPIITVVEGDTGSGKTTLSKYVLDAWVKLVKHSVTPTITGLNNYDLVLYTRGGNKSIQSFLALLTTIMPNVSYMLADDDFLRAVTRLRCLLIFDGLDELSDASQQLLYDIFDRYLQQSNGRLHLLLTTRPYKLKNYIHHINSVPNVITRLKGITPDNRIKFLEKLHDEMINQKMSSKKTQDLTDFTKQLKVRLGEHLRLPLNLTFVAHLWANSSTSLQNTFNSISTATGLYIAMDKLRQAKLFQRLQQKTGVLGMSKEVFEPRCKHFMSVLHCVCFDNQAANSITLSQDHKKQLTDKCTDLELDFVEMTEAFLEVEQELTFTGYTTELSLPHKSIMEYYAAQHFLANIMGSHQHTQLQNLKAYENLCVTEEEQLLLEKLKEKIPKAESLKEVTQRLLGQDVTTADLTPYQNVFLHLGGLMAQEQPALLETHAQDLTELLIRAKTEDLQLLDLLAETKCSNHVAKHIAPHITKKLNVRDGHTGAALALFPELEKNLPVNIILENEVSEVPDLDDLLTQLASRPCVVDLLLSYQWKNSLCGTSDKQLSLLVDEDEDDDEDERCQVLRFKGHLSSLEKLPKTIKKLFITLTCDDQAKVVCQDLEKVHERLTLDYIGLHVMPQVTDKFLRPMPKLKPAKSEVGSLWLSDLTEVDTAVKVVRALLPCEEGRTWKYNCLFLPRSQLSLNQLKQFLLGLHQAEVCLNKMILSSDCIEKHQMVELRQLAADKLICKDVSCVQEPSIW